MALRASGAVLDDAVSAAAANADGGAVQFRTGARPTNVTDAAAGTLLVSVPIPATAFGTPTDGVASGLSLPWTVAGAEDGTIGHARVVVGGMPVWDEDSIGTGGGNAITVNTMTVSDGVDFEVTAYEFSVANP